MTAENLEVKSSENNESSEKPTLERAISSKKEEKKKLEVELGVVGKKLEEIEESTSEVSPEDFIAESVQNQSNKSTAFKEFIGSINNEELGTFFEKIEKKINEESEKTTKDKHKISMLISYKTLIKQRLKIESEVQNAEESLKKEIDPQWGNEKQNEIADKIAKEESTIHEVESGETLGAIILGMKKAGVKELEGKNIWGLDVDYRSEKLKKNKRPQNLAEANLIYPKQFVWIESGKIIVADEKEEVMSEEKSETPTLETPTLETPTLETPTLETPTLETPTLETPTLEEVMENLIEVKKKYDKAVNLCAAKVAKLKELTETPEDFVAKDVLKSWSSSDSWKKEHTIKDIGKGKIEIQEEITILDAAIVAAAEKKNEQDIQNLLVEMGVPESDWEDIKNLPKDVLEKGDRKALWLLTKAIGYLDAKDATRWIHSSENGQKFLSSKAKNLEEWVKLGRLRKSFGGGVKRFKIEQETN